MKNIRLLSLNCFLLLSVVTFISCKEEYKKEIESVLEHAGENRQQLVNVLEHYERINPDKEKLKAAKFLIANMRYHQSIVPDRVTDYSKLDSLAFKADSLLYTHLLNTGADSLYTQPARKKFNQLKNEFGNTIQLSKDDSAGKHKMTEVYDCQWISSGFLIDHIELMFKVKEKSRLLKENKSYFYEYILPYKSIPDYYLIDKSTEYCNLFSKYFNDLPDDSISAKIRRYNFVIPGLKGTISRYPYDEPIGVRELFFNAFHDCIPIAHFGSQILRTQGIPVAVEYNSAYRQLTGIHYHCVVPGDKDKWFTFSPEFTLPTRDSVFFAVKGALNLYRFMYSEQKDSPFFLKGKGEYIPDNLSSPFIRDASGYSMPTVALKLPFNKKTKNKLAYLATFTRDDPHGMIPVTWGEIKGRKAVFKNVIPERLYFPVYYDQTGRKKTFGDSFYMDQKGEITYPEKGSDKNESVNILITSKFPRKPNEIDKTKNLIGSVILAANNPGFESADTVATIDFLLKPYFQDIRLNQSKGPYQYYRFRTPLAYPSAYIGEIQFLASSENSYKHLLDPDPLPILSPEDTLINASVDLIRILEQPLEKIKWKTEYDGNPQTGPAAYPTITFSLDYPMYISTVRIMPVHADNGILPGDTYLLHYLENGNWVLHETIVPKYNFIESKVPKNKLLWLKNITKGKEELPFVVDEKGEQKFIYFDI